jgi:hypothetical protein
MTIRKWAPRALKKLSHFEPFLRQSRAEKYRSVK